MRRAMVFLTTIISISLTLPLGHAAERDWITASNDFTNLALNVDMKHHPEEGTRQGLSKYDVLVAQPTLADEDAERKETEEVVSKLKAALANEKRKEVAQDLEIIIRRLELQFKEQDYERAHKVPFVNASGIVFRGIRPLLDDQTPAERRPAAVARIRKYAGLETGYKPITEILKQRVVEQMAKPGVLYPAKVQIETELGRNSHYLEGMASLCEKYKLTGWEEPYAQLKSQLTEYDAWTKATVLPKAREDFRMPAEEYALALEEYGIDIPPERMAAMAHQGFTEIQEEMKPIAAQIAKGSRLPRAATVEVLP